MKNGKSQRVTKKDGMQEWEIEAWKQQRQVGDQVIALMRRHATTDDAQTK